MSPVINKGFIGVTVDRAVYREHGRFWCKYRKPHAALCYWERATGTWALPCETAFINTHKQLESWRGITSLISKLKGSSLLTASIVTAVFGYLRPHPAVVEHWTAVHLSVVHTNTDIFLSRCCRSIPSLQTSAKVFSIALYLNYCILLDISLQ